MEPENQEDRKLREKAVKLAIAALEGRQISDSSKQHEHFKIVYKDIYNFISNKPYDK